MVLLLTLGVEAGDKVGAGCKCDLPGGRCVPAGPAVESGSAVRSQSGSIWRRKKRSVNPFIRGYD